MKVTGKAVQVKVGAGALMQLKGRFAAWRAVRKRGMRIPPQLWSAAVKMVAVHGACQVAGELNLDYDMLKRRVALAGGRVRSTELAPRFVELFAAAVAMVLGDMRVTVLTARTPPHPKARDSAAAHCRRMRSSINTLNDRYCDGP
jgi:hypothetical protein